MKLVARDYIAMLVVLGVISFKLTGHNGTFDAIVTLIIGYYFGRRQDEFEIKRDSK